MKLESKETHYSCIKTGEFLKINGKFTVKSDQRMTFTGNFNTLEDDYCGDFVYFEKEDGKLNISTNNISPENAINSYKMIIDCVQEIREKLNTFNQE